MTITQGLDYAWTHPPVSALKAAGIQFACRYLSADVSKNLTAAEANALWQAGISIVVVWESGAQDMLRGYAGGAADAAAADMQARRCKLGTVPIYFAADWDATEAQQAQIGAYLDGAASVIGRPRTGIYGGYWPVSRALDAGKAVWAWQTIAWSGGNTDPRRHIQQGAKITVGGVECDADVALQPDFGQFPRPAPAPAPIREPIMDRITATRPGGGSDIYVLLQSGAAVHVQKDATGKTVNRDMPPGTWAALVAAGWRTENSVQVAYLEGIGGDGHDWEDTWHAPETGWQQPVKLA
jgi:hypothetical protein